MGDSQPAEPDIELVSDPVVPIVNPPVGQNDNKNVAQPQELERGRENVERIWNSHSHSLLLKLVQEVLD